MINQALIKRKAKFWLDLISAKAGDQQTYEHTAPLWEKQEVKRKMNPNIVTASDIMSIHGFKNLEQVEDFFVKYGIRPFYSPSGHPFVMVDTLTEAQRAELKFDNEAA